MICHQICQSFNVYNFDIKPLKLTKIVPYLLQTFLKSNLSLIYFISVNISSIKFSFKVIPVLFSILLDYQFFFSACKILSAILSMNVSDSKMLCDRLISLSVNQLLLDLYDFSLVPTIIKILPKHKDTVSIEINTDSWLLVYL